MLLDEEYSVLKRTLCCICESESKGYSIKEDTIYVGVCVCLSVCPFIQGGFSGRKCKVFFK